MRLLNSRFFRVLISIFVLTLQTTGLSCLAGAAPPKQELRSLSPMVDKTDPAAASRASQPPLFKIHAGVSQEYILGPGDVLSVTDATEDKPSTTIAPILPDGTCVITYTGVITAAGMSLREMNELVNETAKKWYVNPAIIVNLAKQRPTQVYMLGELMHPGYYSTGGGAEMPSAMGDSEEDAGAAPDTKAPSSATSGISMQSTLTLSGAIQMAGGLKDTADVRHLRVTRLAPKQTFSIDLWKLMIDGDVTEDIVLQPGDCVYVPKGGADYNANDFGMLVNNRPKVRIIGMVKSPGLFAMSPDDDILSVVSRAGGFDPTAVTKYIILARTNRDGSVSTEKINMTRGFKDGHSPARQKIRPGDMIIVKRSPSKTAGILLGRSAPGLVSGMVMSLLFTQLNKP